MASWRLFSVCVVPCDRYVRRNFWDISKAGMFSKLRYRSKDIKAARNPSHLLLAVIVVVGQVGK